MAGLSADLDAAAADEAALHGAGVLAMLEDRGAGDEGHGIAVDALHQPCGWCSGIARCRDGII
jgi:hypothetical protein